jgi:phosphoglycerate dehydrogenase-like enzyme
VIPKVISIMPLERFQESGISLPPDLDFQFVKARGEDEIIEACRGADFLLLPAVFPVINARILEKIPSIRMIQSAGTGYDKIDVEKAALFHIPVANSPGDNALTVAEFTVALFISLQRRIMLSDREIKAGNYGTIRESLFREGIGELRDTRVGLIGLGAIGREVARTIGLFRARLSYYDPVRVSQRVESELELVYKPFDEIIASGEVISLHVPLSDGTRGLIGKRELRMMRPGAFLINTSRGEVVDQRALAEALEAGRIGGAAIDTVSPEPPPSSHPLLNLTPSARDRLLITPHIGGTTRGAFRRMLQDAVTNIQRVAGGEAPGNVVNGVPQARK